MADPIANPKGTQDLAEALSRALQGVKIDPHEALALARHLLNAPPPPGAFTASHRAPAKAISEGFGYLATYSHASMVGGEGGVLLNLWSAHGGSWIFTATELRALLACAEAGAEPR